MQMHSHRPLFQTIGWWVGCCTILCLPPMAPALMAQAQEPSFQLRVTMNRVARDLNQAQRMLDQAQHADAAGVLNRAIVDLDEAVAGQAPAQLTWARSELQRTVELHRRLQSDEAHLAPIDRLSDVLRRVPTAAVAEPAEMPAEPAAPSALDAVTSVSFRRQIAPILVAKCGQCHIDDDKGRISMATYDSLMNQLDLVHVGKTATSELITVIESGEMPRGSATIENSELVLLKAWIEQGAVCDEADRGVSLNQLAASAGTESMVAGNSATTSTNPVTPSAEMSDSISFSRHIAPVLIDNCAGCHIDAQNVRGGLNLVSFLALGRGGDSGDLFKPGAGADSLLVQKLRGTAGGMQMPAGRGPLPDPTIDLISRWIDEGARFDGFSQTATLRDIFARARAAASSHDELKTGREQRAIANWNLVMGGKQPVIHHSENFTLLAAEESAELDQLAELAEDAAGAVAQQLKLDRDQPIIKGNTAIYVFQVRYDYSEFGKMIEQRELPRESYSQWGNTTLDAYIVLQVKPADYDALGPTLAQSITAIYLKGQSSDVPDWFSSGMGIWTAARIYDNDPFVAEWEARSLKLLQQMPNKDDFLTGRMSSEDAALVGYQFINFLKANGNSQFNKLLKELKSGESFDRSFAVQFGASPAEIIALSTPPENPAGNPTGPGR